MKKFTKVWLVIAGSAFVVGLSFAICGLSMGFKSDWAINKEYYNPQTLIDEQNMEPFDTVDIDTRICDIVFFESDSYSVEVISSVDASNLEFSNENGKLTISLTADQNQDYADMLSIRKNMIDMISLIRGKSEEIIAIGLPTGVELEDVKTNTEFGDMKISDLSAKEITANSAAGKISLYNVKARNINIVAVSGKVELDDVSVERELAMECNLGSAYINKITADTITVDSNSGSVKASDITANKGTIKADLGSVKITDCGINELSIQSNAGAISLKDIEVKELLDINADLGAVNVELKNKKSDYSYELSSDLGSTKVDGRNVDTDYNDIKENNPLIRIATNAGSVSIDFIG